MEELLPDFIRGYELDGGNISHMFVLGLVLGLVAAGVGFYYLIRYYPSCLKVFLLWLLSFVFLWIACLTYVNIIKEEMANLEAAREAVEASQLSQLQKALWQVEAKREPLSKGPVYFWGGAGLVCFIVGFVLMPPMASDQQSSRQSA